MKVRVRFGDTRTAASVSCGGTDPFIVSLSTLYDAEIA